MDVKDYARVAHPPLKEHIDRVARPLLTRENLKEALFAAEPCGVDR